MKGYPKVGKKMGNIEDVEMPWVEGNLNEGTAKFTAKIHAENSQSEQ